MTVAFVKTCCQCGEGMIGRASRAASSQHQEKRKGGNSTISDASRRRARLGKTPHDAFGNREGWGVHARMIELTMEQAEELIQNLVTMIRFLLAEERFVFSWKCWFPLKTTAGLFEIRVPTDNA